MAVHDNTVLGFGHLHSREVRVLYVSPDSVRKELEVPYCIMHLEELAKEEKCEDLTVESTLNAATFIRVTALSHAVNAKEELL